MNAEERIQHNNNNDSSDDELEEPHNEEEEPRNRIQVLHHHNNQRGNMNHRQGERRNRNHHDNNANDMNPAPNQRPRLPVDGPFDNQLAGNPIFSNRFSEITLSVLESKEQAIRSNLNFKYINVFILRIITPAPSSSANVYNRNRNGHNQNAVSFSRIFLAKIHSYAHVEDTNRLVYIMEARNMNSNLWNRNVNHRDNGAVSIGSLVRIARPMPIDSYMRGDIPMVVSHIPVVLLRYPDLIAAVQMNYEIEGNTSFGFVYNNVNLTVHLSSVLKTSCTGNLCDKQRISDWFGSRGCGCYGMASNSSSLAIEHSITIATPHDGERSMEHFSSMKFSKLYLNGDIPGACKLYMLQLTQAEMNLLECIDDCINLINRNGGFTILGWYKRGIINDKSLMTNHSNNNSSRNSNNEQDTQVDSGDISYHIVQIVPTNRAFLDDTTPLGRELNEAKFDVNQIQNAN